MTNDMKCKHCGETWGQHFGAYCNHWGSGEMYQPEGIFLSDICEHCGEQFRDHHKRKFCKAKFTQFKKSITEPTLPEELFEI
jgi:formylmethanofuran dehydrogenase subunit E